MTLGKFTYYKIDHLINKFLSSVFGMKTLEKKIMYTYYTTSNNIKFDQIYYSRIELD